MQNPEESKLLKSTDIGAEDTKLTDIGTEDTKFADIGAEDTSMSVAYHRINESKNSDKRIFG